MVLNEAERICAASLLRYLPLEDLEAVAQTVTQGMVTPTSVKECVKIIIYHSDTPRSLLTRKKVTREILFKYLYDHNVLMTASMDKSHLIDQVLKLWDNKASRYTVGEFKKIIQQDMQIPDHVAGAVEEQKSQQVTKVSNLLPSTVKKQLLYIRMHKTYSWPLFRQTENHEYTARSTTPEDSSKKDSQAVEPPNTTTVKPQCISCPSEIGVDTNSSVADVVPGLSIEEANELALKFSEWFYKLLNIEEDGEDKLGPEHFWQDCNIYMPCISCPSEIGGNKNSSVAAVVPGLSIEEADELALKFSEWFYKLLNIEEDGGDKLGPEHFWQDCSIYMVMVFPTGSIEVMQQSSDNVVEVFLGIKHEHKLYFNPNLSTSGIRGKVDLHGLVMVFACGTLHHLQKCVGVFEQMFLLARDPFSSNNWKVKSTKLRLRSSSGVESVPALKDESITQLLSLPV